MANDVAISCSFATARELHDHICVCQSFLDTNQPTKRKMSDKRSSCIEDLSNELWLDTFDYLDSTNLFLAFYGINKRINQLLVSQKFVSLSLSNSIDGSNSVGKFFQVYNEIVEYT
jgi:hypothetical protein